MRYSLQDLSRAVVPRGFRGKNKVLVQLWFLTRAVFFLPSPHFLSGWRRFLLRLFGAKVGEGANIRPSATITYPWNLTLGPHCYIGDEVVLYNLDRIEIGAHVSISYRSFLCTGTHDYSDPAFPLLIKPIIVSEQAWLGADCFVAPGVHIGKGAIIGARASVFKDVGELEIQVGTPAKCIGSRTIKPLSYPEAAR